MDLLRLFVLLFALSITFARGGIVQHTDYTQNPPLIRDCIEVQCPCGTQARLCEQVGDKAICDECPPGTYQDSTKSSVDIEPGWKCKNHTNCSADEGR